MWGRFPSRPIGADVDPLEEPPEVEEGDDQAAAKLDEPAEVVTVVDLVDAPDLDEPDDGDGDDS